MKNTIEGMLYVQQTAVFDVTGITLLSTIEAEALPKKIGGIGRWWWLCSPGLNGDSAALVFADGSIYSSGHYVYSDNVNVRPALRISNLKSLGLKFGNKVSIFDLDWTVIGDETVLCEKVIKKMPFRNDRYAEDANDFRTSDVKKFLDDWLNEKMNGR